LAKSQTPSDQGSLGLGGLDALAEAAEVKELVVVHHMGHVEERSRGASRLRDWPEVEWQLRRNKDRDGQEVDGGRFFWGFGRDVDVPETELEYDPATRTLLLKPDAQGNAVDRRRARRAAELEVVIKIVTGRPGLTKSKLVAALRDSGGITTNTNELHGLIDDAVAAERIHWEPGSNRSQHYRAGPRPEGVSDTSGTK
jgi:hypothetical protein